MLLALLPLVLVSPTQLPPPGLAPEITIWFAGNRADEGGPYWRPRGDGQEEVLGNELPPADEGYYVDGSKQMEPWMEIEVVVVDPDNPADPTAIVSVQLEWLGAANPAFPPNLIATKSFTRIADHTWALRTDDLPDPILTGEGTHYTFDVRAVDVDGAEHTVSWMKIGKGGVPVRRSVQLNCTPVPDEDISYVPFYMRVGDYSVIVADDHDRHDRFRYDTGPEMGFFDTGELLSQLPLTAPEQRWCMHTVAYWFGADLCVDSFTVKNIYYHTWLSSRASQLPIILGWEKSREHMGAGAWLNWMAWDHANSRSFMDYQGHPDTDSDYGLMTGLLDTQDTTFTDNTIHELSIKIRQNPLFPSIIGGRRAVSFVIFNVPTQAELAGVDTDGDTIEDWDELFTTFTSPFLADTDADNIRDDIEVAAGTDPNNFNEKPKKDPLPVEQG